MALELYWQHHRHFDLNCLSDASKFNRNYETASNSCIDGYNVRYFLLNFEASL
jgi:hypothetical protein